MGAFYYMYRIGGYRTPAFYLFLAISGFSQWSFLQFFVQKCSYFEKKVAKNDHCVSKMSERAFKSRLAFYIYQYGRIVAKTPCVPVS